MPLNSIVIVAIPAEDDYVWKLSSEKVPHLTLLFLGEHEPGPQLTRIASYLEHAVNSLGGKFGLSVERRGPLGDDDADVLFFDKMFVPSRINDFRSHLLQNPDIKELYDSADQYPGWTPHLTLGYPETPAHEDTREYPGTSWVRFDRIALWMGDSEGPTFYLKEEDVRSINPEVSMSDMVDDFLSHYGVKGMKWGVRRSKAQIESASEEGAAVESIRARAKTSGTNALTNKELQTAIDRMQLEKRYSDLANQTAHKSAGKKFVMALLGDIGSTETRRVAKGAASLGVEQALKKAGHKELAVRIKPKKK